MPDYTYAQKDETRATRARASSASAYTKAVPNSASGGGTPEQIAYMAMAMRERLRSRFGESPASMHPSEDSTSTGLSNPSLRKGSAEKETKHAETRQTKQLVDQKLSAFDSKSFWKKKRERKVNALFQSNARFLTSDEFDALTELSYTETGRRWLHRHAFLAEDELLPLYKTASEGFSMPKAEDYPDTQAYRQAINEYRDKKSAFINGQNTVFGNYENIPKGGRLQLAYLADKNGASMDNTLYASKARSITANMIASGQRTYMGETGSVSARAYRDEHIYNRDAEVWSRVLTERDEGEVRASLAQEHGLDDEKASDYAKKYAYSTQLLRRFFLILQAELTYTNDQKSLDALKDWPATVAAATSHGGRTIIRLPKAASRKESGFNHPMMQYLFGSKEEATSAGMFNRHGGTHNVLFKKAGKNTSGALREGQGMIKGFLASLFNNGYTHYGLDAAVYGAIGEKSLSGKTILPDGTNGHLYIGVKLPTTKNDGAVQIGIEEDRMNAGDGIYGHRHNLQGIGGEIKSTGGVRSDVIGDSVGGRVADMRNLGDDWRAQLDALENALRKQGAAEGKSYEQMLAGRKLPRGGADYDG
jgi:hypothetical protein